MNIFALFCKTYKGDFERFKILKESVDKYNKDNLPFYVVCPKCDVDVFDKLRSGKENYEYRIITDEEVLNLKDNEVSEQSWYSQQVIKLIFWKLGLCKHYLSLDSDCYFISDFHKEDYLFNDDIPYLPLTEPLKGAECNFMQIFRSLKKNKEEEKLYNTVSKNYISREGKRMCLNVPPVLSYDALKHMEDNFLKPKNLKASDLIEISPYEYEWYCDYVLKFKPIDYFVCTPFFVSFYNEAFYQLYRKLGFTEEILANYYTGIIMHEGWIKDKKFKKSFIGSIIRKFLIISYLRHEQKYPKKSSFGKKLKRIWRNYYTIPFRVFKNKKS